MTEQRSELERYSATPPTVAGLQQVLQMLIEQGFSDDKVCIFDPETEEWQEVTGLIYNNADKDIKLYCDEP